MQGWRQLCCDGNWDRRTCRYNDRTDSSELVLERERETERERQRQRETETKRDRERQRQRERKREEEMDQTTGRNNNKGSKLMQSSNTQHISLAVHLCPWSSRILHIDILGGQTLDGGSYAKHQIAKLFPTTRSCNAHLGRFRTVCITCCLGGAQSWLPRRGDDI